MWITLKWVNSHIGTVRLNFHTSACAYMWINLKIKPLKKRINSHRSPCAYKRGNTVYYLLKPLPQSLYTICWNHFHSLCLLFNETTANWTYSKWRAIFQYLKIYKKFKQHPINKKKLYSTHTCKVSRKYSNVCSSYSAKNETWRTYRQTHRWTGGVSIFPVPGLWRGGR